MRKFKRVIGLFVPKWIKKYRRDVAWLKSVNRETSKTKALFRAHRPICFINGENRSADYVRQMHKCFSRAKVDISKYYIYPYDSWALRVIPYDAKIICSITVDFGRILRSDIRDLRDRFGHCKDSTFAATQISLIDGIEQFAKSIEENLAKSSATRCRQLNTYFSHMLYRVPESLDEALQKLLFYNALFWQANHWHIGLGRLDKILYEYYERDVCSGRLTRESAKNMLREFCIALSMHTKTKSKTLLGDTGQYILLGGNTREVKAVDNEITHLFLELFAEYEKPDPKLILRVNDETSDSVWTKAVASVCSGNGSPLIMNERVIQQNMVAFGYQKEDVYDLGTSACWEPLVIGKSFDQNNTLPCIIPLESLTNAIEGGECHTFGAFMNRFKGYLSEDIKHHIFDIQYDCSPLFTLFFDDCLQQEKDFTLGGARYAYHGIQVVSLPNTVNSLLNIKQYVFEQHLLTIEQCNQMLNADFDNWEDYRILLQTGALKYGSTADEVLSLTNELQTFIGEEVAKYKLNDRPLKVGFSSPNYIMSCKNVGASMDGRKAGEPFAVHISPISSDIDIAEILDFATRLNYDKSRINGNVVDFTIPTAYIAQQDKLKDLIKDACNRGLFELQLNVLRYEQLLDAKRHPEKYPDLIVRVWGFSAYFNDLPEEYKDNLIERARLYGA